MGVEEEGQFIISFVSYLFSMDFPVEDNLCFVDLYLISAVALTIYPIRTPLFFESCDSISHSDLIA